MDEINRVEINILIVDDNNAPFILPLIRSFAGYKNMHVDVVVFSKDKPHLFRHSRYLRKLYYVEGDIREKFETGLRKVIGQCHPHLIIPTREWISKLFSQHKNWLLTMVKVHPVPDAETIDTLQDKWKLNQWLKANGFPNSRTFPVPKKGEEGPAIPESAFPVLLKPTSGAGGIGIRLVDDVEMLEQILGNEEKYQAGFFIQECIKGSDIDVSLFSAKGEILFHTIQRGIVSQSFSFSKGIEFVRNVRLYELTEKIIRCLSYTGIAHLDFRFDAVKGEYILVDFNARYWNSMQGSRLMGVNFPILVAAHTLEIPVEYVHYQTGYFYYGTAGIKAILRRLVSRKSIPIRFRNTQIPIISRDPLPELMYLIQRLKRAIF